ncbi:hypothetical protein BKA61DRAFT_573910 [Leptodontidium sp. MPI-SDFR-AT-0119]|nr:hypothetical protein BKA61DRAFT_573910 [Leptodontidium sp. MPI-SDFR-AT-0119]
MYAMTTVGTLTRLWIAYKSEDYLEPFVPKGPGLVEIKEYIEANSSDGHYIAEGWEYMKVNNLLPPPRDQILKSQPLVDRTKTDTSTPVVASYAEADVHSYVPDDAENTRARTFRVISTLARPVKGIAGFGLSRMAIARLISAKEKEKEKEKEDRKTNL